MSIQKSLAGRSILRVKQRRHSTLDTIFLNICYVEDPKLVESLSYIPIPVLIENDTISSSDVEQLSQEFATYSTILNAVYEYYKTMDNSVHKDIRDDVILKINSMTMEDLQTLKNKVKLRIFGLGIHDQEYWQFVLWKIHKSIASIVLNDFIDQRMQRYGRVLIQKFKLDQHSKTVVESLNNKIMETIELLPIPKESEEVEQDPWILEQIEKMPLLKGEMLLQDIDKPHTNKPKYFCRVLSGIEWSAYNQVNFNADNLPDNQVLGYKFTIFYPNFNGIPDYTRVNNNEETETIVFKSGHPYVDLRFQIVAREWDTNYKRDFVCIYEDSVLHLEFKFKKQIYRH